MKLSLHVHESRLGEVLFAVDAEGALHRLEFLGLPPIEGKRERVLAELAKQGNEIVWDAAPARHAAERLDAFLAGEREDLGLTLSPSGTPFQRQVWTALERIPFGETISYAELARRIGNPKACRAVARANATNPISLAIPCHRVIGSDGSLTGYGGGMAVKRALIALERGEPLAEQTQLAFGEAQET